MENLELNMMLQRSPDLLVSSMDEEVVMMDISAGQYYGMNAVGSRIWALLETPQSIRTLCDQLLLEFEVEPKACENEVKDFLKQLFDKKVVQTVEQKPTAA